MVSHSGVTQHHSDIISYLPSLSSLLRGEQWHHPQEDYKLFKRTIKSKSVRRWSDKWKGKLWGLFCQMYDCSFPGTDTNEIRGRAGGIDYLPKCSSLMLTCLSTVMPSGLVLCNQIWFCTNYFWTWFCDTQFSTYPSSKSTLEKEICSQWTTQEVGFFHLSI